ncbi:heparinase II/III family protein [Metabacillus sp. GX 13764]|uniref:heparinase II/III domain-containing protein n=1 Tax=Metabacillus kandeliae TaxID=2900151 RepID=UPI001E516FEF|nr:heparinase II/III family protein [Metabacillus kandeliae]MCD7032966.1 heparinase II/III family protein [Metabacillus kandeliae]
MIEVLDLPLIEAGEEAELFVFHNEKRISVTPVIKNPGIVSWKNGAVKGEKPGTAEIAITCQNETVLKKIKVLSKQQKLNVSALKKRPRILFKENAVTEIRNNLQHYLDAWGAFLSRANQFAEETSFLVTYGNAPDRIQVKLPLKQLPARKSPKGYVDYPFWTMFSRAVEERIQDLSIAWTLTGASIYAEKAKELMLGLAEFTRWYEYPKRGAEGNLSNAHFLMGQAIGYDTLYSILAPAEKEKIKNSIVTHGLRPLAADLNNMDTHNIICSKQCAIMLGALAIRDEYPHAEKYIAGAHHYLTSYLDERIDTPETEGLLYTAAACKHIMIAAAAFKRAADDDSLIMHPYLANVLPEQFIYFMAPGKKASFANFSDSGHSIHIAPIMGALADVNQDPVSKWFLEKYVPDDSRSFLYRKNSEPALAPSEVFEKPYVKSLPIGWACIRSGWGDADHMLAVCSSSSKRDHNHFDQNHFILNAGGEWLITDPGYQDYRPGPRSQFTLGSKGHNTLLINGEGQCTRGGGRISSVRKGNKAVLIKAVADDCYGGRLHSFTRSIIGHESGFYILFDSIEKRSRGDKAVLLFNSTQAFLSADGTPLKTGSTAGRQITIAGENHAADLIFPQKDAELKLVKQRGALDHEKAVSAAADELLVTIIVPRISKQPSPFRFEWHEKENCLWFQREGKQEIEKIELPLH